MVFKKRPSAIPEPLQDEVLDGVATASAIGEPVVEAPLDRIHEATPSAADEPDPVSMIIIEEIEEETMCGSVYVLPHHRGVLR